jgi:hypothetical protein
MVVALPPAPVVDRFDQPLPGDAPPDPDATGPEPTGPGAPPAARASAGPTAPVEQFRDRAANALLALNSQSPFVPRVELAVDPPGDPPARARPAGLDVTVAPIPFSGAVAETSPVSPPVPVAVAGPELPV